ncbi:MAG: pyridoxamine 5'-phosphate oxidase family protein [Acidimicrobiia bacterium]|nr:pyridoxamine 5'-phosphate oxidase family protein [Acidimicrobiia bacterium]
MCEGLPQEKPGPPSERVRVRRLADRARYERSGVLGILDAGLIAHVGVSTPDGPVVLPMAYGRDEDHLYLHGAVGNNLLRTGDGQEICVTVTHLDGLVMARTPFHNSMNYRSVVVRGRARKIVDGDRKLRALRIITDHVVANWDTTRLPSASDLRSTLVLELPLAEASAKVRRGDPVDKPEDLAGPWWAGVVPISTRFEAAVPSSDLTGDLEAPASIQALSGLTPDERDVGRDA